MNEDSVEIVFPIWHTVLLICILIGSVLHLCYLIQKRRRKLKTSCHPKQQLPTDVKYEKDLNRSMYKSSINTLNEEMHSLREIQGELRNQVQVLRSVVAKTKKRKE